MTVQRCRWCGSEDITVTKDLFKDQTVHFHLRCFGCNKGHYVPHTVELREQYKDQPGLDRKERRSLRKQQIAERKTMNKEKDQQALF